MTISNPRKIRGAIRAAEAVKEHFIRFGMDYRVSLRYRDDAKRGRFRDAVRLGFLCRSRRIEHGHYRYWLHEDSDMRVAGFKMRLTIAAMPESKP